MTEPTPPSRDPFEGIDPETWAILAAQQSGASPAADPRDGAAGGAGASAGSAAWGPDPAGGQASVGRGAGAGGWPVSAGPAAWAATITTAVVLVVAALVDPSGLAAPIAWSGADVVPSLPWTWLQYALQGPLIVLLVWLGTRRLLRAATPAAPRRWVLSRTWLLVVLALMVAKLGYGLAWMAPFLLGGGDEGLPPDTSVPYLAWATGFVAVKGLLIGWVPALAAALAWRAGQARRAGAASVTIEPSLALAPAGLVVLALVPLGPWLTQHWWTGSPIGYAHASDWRLLAPTTAGGALSQVAALLIVWLLLASSIRATLRRVATPRPAAALRLAGSLAGVVAGLGLAVVQSVLALAAGTDLAGGDDLWIVPSTYLRLIEGLSFGLLLAPLAAIATWLVPRAPRPRWTLGGVLVGVLAVGVAIMLVVRAGEREVAPAPLAATDTPPVALPAAAAVLTPSASGPPRRLTVRRDADGTAVLADQAGAQVTLRGINVNQLGDYYAANPAVAPVQPLTEQDFADIAAMGMNAVRLVLSWSLLEPTAGQVDDGYLAEVRRAVRWAGASGIHVVLDLHQDAWGKEVVAPAGTTCRAGTSPMTGWDGAPAWATAMDDAPPCQFTGRDLAPNVLRAFTSFSTDRDAAQARLLAVWQRLAREFGGDPTVAGYDLLNEPSFAEQAPMTSGMLLGRYHALAIRAIRAGEQQAAGGYAHPVFLEPSIWWSGFGVDPLPPRGFTADPQVVFAPHLYNESITMDQSL
ncbi:MAG TPA: cellulase family glycosylhydrolase, partial [Candidatus Nanopelagicales bacterium]